MSGEYRVNPERSTIHVRFPARPSPMFLDILKNAGFRWNPRSGSWYAPYSRAGVQAAQMVAVPERSVLQEDRPCEFKFGNKLDLDQKKVVVDTEGPMLVVAGPGSGKTSAIVKRIAYLVLEKGVPPEQIMVATFSRKAAHELLTRISNEFAHLRHPVNVERMRIGTFHSLCQKILAEYAEWSGLKNFTVLEDYDQRFLVQHSKRFRGLMDSGLFLGPNGYPLRSDKYADRFVACSNTLTEERVSLEALRTSDEPGAAVLSQGIELYHAVMAEKNRLDYADIQARVLDMLEQHPEVLEDLRRKIRYILVDEYQDTNFIQEQLVLLIAGDRGNVCVVGDDDQSLYRFRGATVQNILEFQGRFGGECRSLKLLTNYRSQPGIVAFCHEWMGQIPGYWGDYTWGSCRHDKSLRANPHFDKQALNPVSVACCKASNEDEWHERMLQLVRSIEQSPEFVDRNQIAFLCSSVRSHKIRGLISYFEEHGVRVSAPRANMFFDREEVRTAIGCLVACFPSCDRLAGFDECRSAAQAAFAEHSDLAQWAVQKRAVLNKQGMPAEGLDYAFSGLFYEMMAFQPFREWLDRTSSMGAVDVAPARNLSIVASICASFESSERYLCFSANGVESMSVRFFKKYLLGIIDAGGIGEYEDEREYAPTGCVSFMTIHQAKGMEFPVVVVCSLEDEVWNQEDPLLDVIRSLNTKRVEREPRERRADFDFWRKYYTAFSRAQDLLVLTSAGTASITASFAKPDPSNLFFGVYRGLPDVFGLDFSSLHLRTVKPVNILRSYAFTADIAAYHACPRRYKFNRELGFPQASGQGMLFGTLVHQSVEDIHRIVKRWRDEGKPINSLFIPPDDVRAIVSANRAAIEQSEGVRLLSSEDAAFRQVMKYLKHSKNIWRDVVEPEASVSEVRNGFVLKGVIDLIHGSDDCVEIVDFKTGKRPLEGSRLLEKYRRQMLVYAHLVRTQLGLEVSGAKLYFTSDAADYPVVDVEVSDQAVEGILREFDETVAHIEACEFDGLAEDRVECEGCPFAAYCGRTR